MNRGRRDILAVLGGLALAGAAPVDPGAPGPHQLDAPGAKLWYRVAGRPTGEPVIVLHGGPGEGSQTFAKFAGPALETRLRMVYLDQRGSGRSERPKDEAAYSIDILVHDIELLRQRLGAPRVALVGHSFGTILALEYAARYPTRVSRVVLAGAVPDLPAMFEVICQRLKVQDPAAYARAAAGQPADAHPSCQPFSAYEGKAGAAFVRGNMYPDPKTAELVDAADAADGLGNTGELSNALSKQGLWSYRFAKTRAVTAPVLVIAGEEDHEAVIEPQSALAAALPHGRLLPYPGHGHFMFVEDPERFARDVAAFIKTGR